MSSSTSSFNVEGVKLRYLREFISYHGGEDHFRGLTTTQVNDLYLKPMTVASQLSLCEQLKQEGNVNNVVQRATYFISHAWKYEFLEVIEAVEHYFQTNVQQQQQQHDEVNDDIIIWFDLFVNSQHGCAEKPFEWWVNTFKGAIGEMENGVLMVMSPWDDPVTLTRAWCIFEVYSCQDTNNKFNIAMPSRERTRFLRMITDANAFKNMLGKIKSEKSECFIPADKERIFDAIQKTIGFTRMDRAVFSTLEGWFERELKKLIADSFSNGDEIEMSKWQNALGNIYRNTGRFQEAEPLYIECLDARRRTLGHEHPSTLNSINNLAGLYESQGKYDEAEPLYIDCLETRKSTLGREHPSTLNSINNLALLYHSQGKYSEAETLFKNCVEAYKRTLGPQHPDTLNAIENFTNCLNN